MKCEVTCFAASVKDGQDYCGITTYKTCKGKECPFYKTQMQFVNDRRKASEINRRKGVVVPV